MLHNWFAALQIALSLAYTPVGWEDLLGYSVHVGLLVSSIWLQQLLFLDLYAFRSRSFILLHIYTRGVYIWHLPIIINIIYTLGVIVN